MIALIQRVREAEIQVAGESLGRIGPGILALIGMVHGDSAAHGERLLQRILGYRIFGDEAGRMNLSLAQTGGGLLLVPQFTLAADTSQGLSTAAAPAIAQPLFEALLAAARAQHQPVACGRFGADMQVSLVNDGPVTFWLES